MAYKKNEKHPSKRLSRKIQVNVTPDEYDIIETAAESGGFGTMSNVLRAIMLKALERNGGTGLKNETGKTE